jgi:hypothetical protein
MIAVKLGHAFQVQTLIAKRLHTEITDNKVFDKFEELWVKLFGSTLIHTSKPANPEMLAPIKAIMFVDYYAVFDRDEEAVEFKLRYL